jgi:NTP pyrophosphatase (non-canonical NTP hydrolase)
MATKKTKSKAQLHEEIGELLHSAKVRLEMLGHSGSKAYKEQCSKARSEVTRAHNAFKASIGSRRR